MEWTIAFILTFFYLSIAADLWPAGKSSPRYMRRLARWQEKHEPANLQHDFTGRKAFAEHPENWQERAEQMKQESVARNQGLQVPIVAHTPGTPNTGSPTPDSLVPIHPPDRTATATPMSFASFTTARTEETFHTAHMSNNNSEGDLARYNQ